MYKRQLALCSQLVDPNNKIGRGLTDHPAYFYNRLLELPTEGPLAWLGDSKGHSKVLLRHKNGDPAEHPYNIELLINARYWDTRHADDDLWRERILSDDPARVEIKFIFNSRLNDCNRIRLKEDGRPTVRVARNETGVPFKKEIARVRNIILRALEAKGSDSLEDCYLEGEWREGVHGSVHHAGGSLRMSDNGSGVVDHDLKFEAYDNLYCCDVSVFPSIPAANPSLTLVALALRLAKTLKARLAGAS